MTSKMNTLLYMRHNNYLKMYQVLFS